MYPKQDVIHSIAKTIQTRNAGTERTNEKWAQPWEQEVGHIPFTGERTGTEGFQSLRSSTTARLNAVGYLYRWSKSVLIVK
jgi:hypothetical protein